jgi:mevalonate kinase
MMASAPGNLFFFGEHAVVYGKPAIIAAADRRTHVACERAAAGEIRIESEAFGTATAALREGQVAGRKGPKELEILLELCEFAANAFDISGGFSLRIRSEVPVNSGMSSSTAVLCSSLAAILGEFGKEMPKSEYYKMLYPFQKKLHGGRASGAELISSSVGGFNLFRKEGEWIGYESLGELPLSIVVGDTKVQSPTSLTVGYHVPSLMERYPEKVAKVFDDIGALVDEGRKAILNKDVNKIGELMNANQELLASLGLSHPKLDDCISEARNAGALGAKLSGSGWGGVMLALTNPEDQERVAQAMARTRANVIKTKTGVAGVV